MNATLEHEIIEKYGQLEPDAQQRVRSAILDAPAEKFDYAKWRAQLDALQERIRGRSGTAQEISSLELLREVRGEEP